MESGLLEEYLETSRQRLEVFLNRADELPKARRESVELDDRFRSQEQALLLESLEELSMALEELHVASEELRRQNQEALAIQIALAAESKHYKELFDLAPDGYLVTDKNGTIEEANQRAATWLNVASSRLENKPLTVFVAPSNRRNFCTQLNELQKGEEITNWEVVMQPRNGEELLVVFTVVPVKDATGKTVKLRWGMQISGRSLEKPKNDNCDSENLNFLASESQVKEEDNWALAPPENRQIDARDRADRENNWQAQPEKTEKRSDGWLCQNLAEKREKEKQERRDRLFRLMFEKAAVGMAFVDSSGCAIANNQVLEKMLGYSRQELRKTSLIKLTFPLDRKVDRKLFEEIKAGKRNGYAVEKRFLTKMGCLKMGTVTVAAVRDANGDPIGALMSIDFG